MSWITLTRSMPVSTPEMRYRGLLYRALNPVWAREPLSGEGARRFGGRFNPKGLPALYTSLTIRTALREANQIGTLQPTTLVALRADLEPVFDASDPDALAALGFDPAEIAGDDWRERMRRDHLPPGQRFAKHLIDSGHAGLIVPSYARGAGKDERNLVLWRWGDILPAQVTLVDDEGRLG